MYFLIFTIFYFTGKTLQAATYKNMHTCTLEEDNLAMLVIFLRW